MPFLMNAWYMVAWSDDLEAAPFARTVLGIPMVLYRAPSHGRVVALRDRCSHRFAPLSMGQLVGDGIECPYHGLVFDAGGRCVGNPFGAPTPAAAKVAAYPVHEVDGTVWVWPGDPALADATQVPRIEHHQPESPFSGQLARGLTTAKADYRLLSDNLMDLSHTALLHPGLGGRLYQPKVSCHEDTDGGIVAEFSIPNAPNFGGDDYLDAIRWTAPSVHVLHSRSFAPGTRDVTWHIPSAHILTPETERTTHYFWSSGAAEGMAAADLHAALVQAFDHEDKPMVEAVQRAMGDADLWDLQPVLLASDAAAVRMRRRLQALIAAEQATTTR